MRSLAIFLACLFFGSWFLSGAIAWLLAIEVARHRRHPLATAKNTTPS